MESRAPASADSTPSLLRRGSQAILRSLGWTSLLVPLPGPQGIVVVYPHTSNWDFIIGVLYKIGVSLRVRWVGKHTLFRWPLRRLFLRLGGVPIRRNQRSGFVDAVLAEFARGEPMWLAVTPEGTRSRTSSWKSGFYRIALAADLPVGLGYIDYFHPHHWNRHLHQVDRGCDRRFRPHPRVLQGQAGPAAGKRGRHTAAAMIDAKGPSAGLSGSGRPLPGRSGGSLRRRVRRSPSAGPPFEPWAARHRTIGRIAPFCRMKCRSADVDPHPH